MTELPDTTPNPSPSISPNALPNTLEEAVAQARTATQAALADGYQRLLVELVFPELKVMPVAEQFLPAVAEYGTALKILFPDAGASALARRDWKGVSYKIDDIGFERSPIERKIDPKDACYLLVEPSAVEVRQVERLCNAVEGKPVIMLNPKLEDVVEIGIGYAGRQLRERFLSTLESCYYVRPVEGGAVFRCYPFPWQVWLEIENGDYKLIAELPQRPVGEALDRIFLEATQPKNLPETESASEAARAAKKRGGLFEGMKRFLKALNQ